jgi:hypothetical protein
MPAVLVDTRRADRSPAWVSIVDAIGVLTVRSRL